MTKELIFSLNTVLPLIILIGIGYIIRISGILNDVFFTGAEKFVFKVALPCSLFMSVYGANSGETFSKSLIIFCVTAIAAVFILPCLIVPLFIKKIRCAEPLFKEHTAQILQFSDCRWRIDYSRKPGKPPQVLSCLLLFRCSIFLQLLY